MFVKPRQYQQNIIDRTLETTKSILIQLPTGGGKTIISKEIAIGLINNFNKKILFIAPKIVLMEQTLETFKGLKPQKVHGSNNKFDKNHNILISTLQTASRRNSLNPDVIIIDEVHFGYEKKMLNKIMEYNPNARIIGLSATPFDENGYPFKGFDVIINDYDLVYMIKNKYLVPLRSYILVKPDLSNVDIIAGDYEINQLSEAVSKNTIIMEIVATSKSYIEKSIKTIVFAVDINHAELLKTAFQNEGFATEALHSKSEKDDSEVIERFKKGYIKVLVSVLKLTTGFDVPETDLAIIARPTKSQNLYKQMVGRVLRIVDYEKTGIDKNFAILLDCGNVIENLGKPLDPIIPKDELEKKIQKLKCKHCESENIKLKKSESNLFWECQDCGFIKELENKNHYTCCNCNKKYSYENGEFELINKTLYLNCECGYDTAISMATGEEEFRKVDSGIDISVITEKIDKDIVPLNKYKNLTVENIYMFFDEIKSYKDNEANKNNERMSNENFSLVSKNIFFSIEEEKKTLLNTLCEKIFLSLKEQNSVDLIDTIIKQSIIYLNNIELMEYFSDYCMIYKKEFEEFKIEILENIEKKKKFDLLSILLESNFFNNNYVVEKSYEYKFFNIVKFLIEKNRINKFNYYLGINIDFEFDTLLEKIDLDFFDVISDFTKCIDIGECFSLTNIFDIEDDRDTLIKAFNKLINDLVILNNHFKEKDVEILVYNKEISFDFPDFSILKSFIQQKNFKKLEDWFKYINSTILIPFTPNKVYSEWTNWEDFLGNENIIDEDTFDYIEENYLLSTVFDLDKLTTYELEILRNYFKYTDNKYLSFEKSKQYVHSLNLESQKDWDKLVLDNNLPKFIHKYPHFHFSKYGWKNWDDWLGIQNKTVKKFKYNDLLDNSNYLSYDNAKKYIKEKGIKTKDEWKAFANSKDFPAFLSTEPHFFYQNSGWINFDHWLDKEIIIRNKPKKIEEISIGEMASDLNKSIIGCFVSHKKFGKGKVIDSERNAKELFLTIDFNGSVKKILSSFLD